MNKETIEAITQSMFESSLLTNKTDVIQLHLKTIKSILEKHLLKEEWWLKKFGNIWFKKKKIELITASDILPDQATTNKSIVLKINEIISFLNQL